LLNPSPPLSAGVDHPQLFALLRNAHLSVLYEHPTGAFYTLATDGAFLRVLSVVWERLEDVDQGGAMFVDARLERSVAGGCDGAGWTSGVYAPNIGDTSECVFFRFLPFSICLIVLQSCTGTRPRSL
jgi:hypothetical protein